MKDHDLSIIIHLQQFTLFLLISSYLLKKLTAYRCDISECNLYTVFFFFILRTIKLRTGVLIQWYFCKGFDYGEKTDLSESS